MEAHQVLNLLFEAGKNNPQKFGEIYFENFRAIYEHVKNFQGLKSDLYLNDTKSELNKIRFSIVFSDLTSIYFQNPFLNEESANIIIPDNVSADFKITLPESVANEIKNSNGSFVIHPGFLTRSEKDIKRTVGLIEPLLEKRKAIMHNIRTVMCLAENPKGGDDIYKVFPVTPNSPLGHWFVSDNSSHTDSLPIEFSPSLYRNKEELFDVSIPYIQNAPFDVILKILEDNEDIINNFRTGLKSLVDEAKKGGKTLDEIKYDLVDIELEKITKKFRSIKSLLKLKVRGSVGFITLSLLSLTAADFQPALFIPAITGGLGYMGNAELEFQKQFDELRDQRLFLLWKFKN